MKKQPQAYNVPSRIDCGLRSKKPRLKNLLDQYPEHQETGSSGEDHSKILQRDIKTSQKQATTKASTGSRCLTPAQPRKVAVASREDLSHSAYASNKSLSNPGSNLALKSRNLNSKAPKRGSKQNLHEEFEQAYKEPHNIVYNNIEYPSHQSQLRPKDKAAKGLKLQYASGHKQQTAQIKDEFSIKVDQKMEEMQEHALKEVSKYQQLKYDRMSDRRKREIEAERQRQEDELRLEKERQIE